MEERPQEAPALRDALRDHVIDPHRGRRLVAVARPGREVADRQQPGADHRAFGRGVDEVVDAAGFESAGERDASRVGDRRIPVIAVPAGECPPVARNAHRGIEQVLAHPERGIRIIGVDRRYRRMVADRADVVIGKREGIGGPVGLDAELHPARGGAPRARDGGGAQPQAHRRVRSVPLPAAPCDAPPAFEQKTVPGRDLVGGHQVERRHVERAHRDPVATVRHVEEQRAVGARGIDGDKEGRIAAESDLSVRVPLRTIQIDDSRVGRMRGIHHVVRDGIDPLVRPGVSEHPALLERLAPHDLESCQSHGGLRRPCSAATPRPVAHYVRHVLSRDIDLRRRSGARGRGDLVFD